MFYSIVVLADDSSGADAESGVSQDLDSLAEDVLLEQLLRRDPVPLSNRAEEQHVSRCLSQQLHMEAMLCPDNMTLFMSHQQTCIQHAKPARN